MFHNLRRCLELLPGLQAVFAIPNMNALPVHCANQVFFRSLGALFFVFVLSKFFSQVLELSFSILESILESLGGHLEVILMTFWW